MWLWYMMAKFMYHQFIRLLVMEPLSCLQYMTTQQSRLMVVILFQ